MAPCISTLKACSRAFHAILSGIFSPCGKNWTQTGSRTALALVAFVVAHAGGVVTFHLGPHHYNAHGHLLKRTKLLGALEVYLLLCALAHSSTSAVKVLCKLQMVMRTSLAPSEKLNILVKPGTLLISGLALAVFLFRHVRSFRLGESGVKTCTLRPCWTPPFFSRSDHVVATTVKDLYSMQVAYFHSCGRVFGYTAAVGLLALHLIIGWESSVAAFNLDPEAASVALWLGRGSTVAVAASFVSVAVASYRRQRESS